VRAGDGGGVDNEGEGDEGGDDGPAERRANGDAPDPREAHLFGELAVEAVRRLRVGVAAGELDELAAAQAIVVGAQKMRALKVGGGELPPVFRLFEEKVYHTVVEALLPDADPTFRRKVTEILHDASRGQVPVPAPAN
jgi:hypothetical protein